MAIIKFVGLIVAFYLLIIVLGFFFQRAMIYRPSNSIPSHSDRQAVGMEVVNIKSSGGLELKSWYRRAVQGRPTLLYFQGNAGNIADRASLIRPYLAKGIGVLLVGYRGYGGNPGYPSEKGLYDDARGALDYLRQQQKVSARCIVLLGESIGAGLAVQLAMEQPVAALILQSPFSSLVDLASYHYPFLPVDWLLKDRYLNNKKIMKIKSPLLMLVGQEDFIVPASHSMRVYALAHQPKEMKIYEGVGHNTLHPLIQNDVLQFINHFVTHCRVPKD